MEYDFDELAVGRTFSTRGRTVTEADVVMFGSLTGDRHPQHMDAAWSARSAFGERIAHGALVVSYAIGLLDVDPERVVALRRIRDVAFKAPVRLGDTITVEARVERLCPLAGDLGLVGLGCRVRRDDGKVVVRMALEAIWRRTAGTPPAGQDCDLTSEELSLEGLAV